MKTVVQLALLGYTQAISNAAGSDEKSENSVWVEGKDLYESKWDRMCNIKDDCAGEDYICADHMWEYNNQQESARGCWHKSVCNPKTMGSFWMFDGRAIQFWCDEQTYNYLDTFTPPSYGDIAYPIWEAGYEHWGRWEETCQSHDDCKMRNGDMSQHCTDFIWTATEDRQSWANGTACYSYEDNKCQDQSQTEESFSIRNANYDVTQFSFHTQLWCKGPDYGFEGGMTGATTSDPDMRRGDDSDGDRRGRSGSDSDGDRRGDGLVIEQDSDGMRIRTDMSGMSMELEQGDDGMRLQLIMGATKLVATAATSLVAASLY